MFITSWSLTYAYIRHTVADWLFALLLRVLRKTDWTPMISHELEYIQHHLNKITGLMTFNEEEMTLLTQNFSKDKHITILIKETLPERSDRIYDFNMHLSKVLRNCSLMAQTLGTREYLWFLQTSGMLAIALEQLWTSAMSQLFDELAKRAGKDEKAEFLREVQQTLGETAIVIDHEDEEPN